MRFLFTLETVVTISVNLEMKCDVIKSKMKVCYNNNKKNPNVVFGGKYLNSPARPKRAWDGMMGDVKKPAPPPPPHQRRIRPTSSLWNIQRNRAQSYAKTLANFTFTLKKLFGERKKLIKSCDNVSLNFYLCNFLVLNFG